MATRMQQRRGLAAQWTAANPVLAAGEIGFETDSNKFKIGDGTNTWSLLKYFINLDGLDIDIDGFIKDDKKGVANGVASLDSRGLLPIEQLPDAHLTTKINAKIAEVVGAAPETLNTLNEISAAFGNDPNYASTVAASVASKAPLASPTFTGTVTVPEQEVTDISAKAASTSHVSAKVNAAKTLMNATFIAADAALEGRVLTTTDTLAASINTLSTAADAAVTSIATLGSRVSATESDITVAETNITTLNSITTATDSSVDVLENRTTALETSVLALGTEVGGVGAVISRIDSAEADINTLESTTATLDTRLDNHDTTITALQTSAGTLETAKSAAEGRLNTAEADVVALKTKATTSQTHIAATTSVHGIADTAALATKSYADSAKTDAITTSATAIALKANIASPTFTGVPSAPTATAGTSTTQVATTAFVGTAVSALVASAPEALNTLNELATALGNDANFASTLTTNLSSKLNTSNFTYSTITIPVYDTAAALPAAASNHGRWAHVHGEGAMYYAHAGSWVKVSTASSTINVMSGAHTAVQEDVSNVREMSGGGTFTIPSDTSFWPIGAVVDVIQTTSSQVTIAGGSGVTVNATPGLKLRAQWSSATVLKRAANTFVVLGDLSA